MTFHQPLQGQRGKAAVASGGSNPVPLRRSDPPHPGELARVPVRHRLRWIAVAAALILLAQFIHGLATNPGWEWGVFGQYFFSSSILGAVGITVELTVLGTVLSALGGFVLAMMRLSRSHVLQAVSWGYVWVIRSVPLLVQLLFWFNLAYLYGTIRLGVPFGPSLVSFKTVNLISAMVAAVLGLSLYYSAYASEIIRSGVLAVDQGQMDAAASLGIPRHRQVRKILIPQALHAILPAMANEVIGMLKGTSQVYILAVGDLLYEVQVIYSRNGQIVPLLMVATVWYLILITVLSVLQSALERHFERGTKRGRAPDHNERTKSFLDSARKLAGQ